eukprot:TRINITY_DN1190_c0_g1_i1.p1 TRINITY_DN1190_c0_g1~~TRINITY_DN1190_c0_g1_i1.p1  ORF type:complete len:131 (+),score=53.24 TRINITY_DN1190_c0_g1_i1:56-448(+)
MAVHASLFALVLLVAVAAAHAARADEKVPINAFPIALHSDAVVLSGDHAVNITAGDAINIGQDTPVVRIHPDASLRVPYMRDVATLAGYKCAADGEMKLNAPPGAAPEVCFCLEDLDSSRFVWHCALLSK